MVKLGFAHLDVGDLGVDEGVEGDGGRLDVAQLGFAHLDVGLEGVDVGEYDVAHLDIEALTVRVRCVWGPVSVIVDDLLHCDWDNHPGVVAFGG